MVDETGKNIGITELESEENKENNSMSFDEIDFNMQVKKELNSKIDVTKVEEPVEENEEDEFDSEDDYEPTEEDLNNDFEGEVEE